ncbi:MAG: hypothetical protein ACT4OE_04355 [Sphingosinicella sp.]
MRFPVIDNFALALTHGLMLLAAWRLLARADLNSDGPSSTHPLPLPSREGSRDSDGAGAGHA